MKTPRAYCLKCREYLPIDRFASAFEAGTDSSECMLHWGTKQRNRIKLIRDSRQQTAERRAEALDEAIDRAHK